MSDYVKDNGNGSVKIDVRTVMLTDITGWGIAYEKPYTNLGPSYMEVILKGIGAVCISSRTSELKEEMDAKLPKMIQEARAAEAAAAKGGPGNGGSNVKEMRWMDRC